MWGRVLTRMQSKVEACTSCNKLGRACPGVIYVACLIFKEYKYTKKLEVE